MKTKNLSAQLNPDSYRDKNSNGSVRRTPYGASRLSAGRRSPSLCADKREGKSLAVIASPPANNNIFKRWRAGLLSFLIFNFSFLIGFAQISYTLEDRDRAIRTEVKLEEMNKRFEQRFEQIDKRFEQTDKRFEQMERNYQWQFGILVSAMFILFGFILWDRRTFLKPFRLKVEEVELAMEREKAQTRNLLAALRELAKSDSNVAQVLKQFNLL